MEEEGPCELVFTNPKTNHFAVFDKRLIFKRSWHATLYVHTVPKPPKGLIWLKVFFDENQDEVTSNTACVDFETLVNEITGVSEQGPNYVVLFRTKNKILCKPCIEPALFGSRIKAVSQFKNLFGKPEDVEIVVRRWKDGSLEEYNALPLWNDVPSDDE